MVRCIVDGRFVCVGCGVCKPFLEVARLRLEEEERVGVAEKEKGEVSGFSAHNSEGIASCFS